MHAQAATSPKPSSCGFADTLHQPFHDDRYAIERLRYGNHPQDRRPQPDHAPVPAEQPYQRFREGEQQSAGQDHQPDLQRQDRTSQPFQALMVLRAVGVPAQGGRRRLHSPARDIEQALHRIRNGMRRGRNAAQRVDHGREDHISEGGREALRQVRKRNPEASPENLRIRPERLPFRGDCRMLP